ncbi:fin bud initiation factor a [Clarias gariepinus]
MLDHMRERERERNLRRTVGVKKKRCGSLLLHTHTHTHTPPAHHSLPGARAVLRAVRMMLLVFPPLALALLSLPVYEATYSGPLQPEISNGTFHHFFVPDGDYEETEDPEKCQMLFKWLDRSPCLVEEDRDSVIRDDFISIKQQVEDSARVLESLERSVSHDLDGEDTYSKYLRNEIEQITQAFSGVEKSLLELEVKFKQSQETDLREDQEFTNTLMSPMLSVSSSLQETLDISSGLKDKHELISLIIRSHGTRLNRLKNEYLNI